MMKSIVFISTKSKMSKIHFLKTGTEAAINCGTYNYKHVQPELIFFFFAIPADPPNAQHCYRLMYSF